MPNQWTSGPDFSEANCDYWAVDTAVREGIRMNLNRDELLLAVVKLKARNGTMTPEEIAAHLKISIQKAWAVDRRYSRWRHQLVA